MAQQTDVANDVHVCVCVSLTGGGVAQQTDVANDVHVCVCLSDRWRCGSTDYWNASAPQCVTR